MIKKYALLLFLLSSYLNATSALVGKSFQLDRDNIEDNITCLDGLHCTLSTSLGIKKKYDMQRVFSSYMGFRKYKNMPKGVLVLELGYWGYAEHRFFKYEPQYEELFQTKIEYFYNTMSMEGGEEKIKLCKTIRPNLDASKVLISDKKVLAELSRFFGKKIKNEIIFDTQKEYLLTSKNIEAYNNIAYYLNKENIEGAEAMLHFIIKAFPKRAVSYYTLADFYSKRFNVSKMKEAYMNYVWQMIKQNKMHKIPKKISKKLKDLYLIIKNLTKEYEHLSAIRWGDLNKDKVDDLVLFVESKKGKNKLLVYIYDVKRNRYILVGTNGHLPSSYENIKSQNQIDTKEDEMEDFYFVSDIHLDKLLILSFSQANYHTIFRGVDNKYKFQYRNKKMELIGAELLNYSRARGAGVQESINYLSRKKEIYSVVDVHTKKGKSKLSKLKEKKLLNLGEFRYEDVY